MHRLPVGDPELARQVEAFRRKLGSRDLDFQGPARRLYDLLLAAAAPELRGKRSLCIVPDRALWDLPFRSSSPAIPRSCWTAMPSPMRLRSVC